MISSIPFVVYGTVLVALGYYGSRRSAQLAAEGGDIRAGLSYWITAISAHASDMSSWLFLGLPAAVYRNGIVECWTAIGLLGGMWLTWHCIAPRLRELSGRYNVVTLSGLLSVHGRDTSGLIRVTAGLTALFFFTFYIASGLKGSATLLHETVGLSEGLCISVSSILLLCYAFVGGYAGITFVDCFQGIFLMAMIVIVPVTLYWQLPSSTDVLSTLTFAGSPSAGSIIITMLSWGLGYFGIPHVLTKFMTLDRPEMMKRGQYVGMSWQLITLGAAVATGLLGRFFYTAAIADETFFIKLITDFFSPVMTGCILCGVLAATLSTIDAQLIIAGEMFVDDVLGIRTESSGKILKGVLAAIMTSAGLIAYGSHAYLYDIVKYAWSGLGSTFGPLVLATLLPFSVHPTASFGGMIAGAFAAGLWPHTALFLSDAPLIVGFIANCATQAVIHWYMNATRDSRAE